MIFSWLIVACFAYLSPAVASVKAAYETLNINKIDVWTVRHEMWKQNHKRVWKKILEDSIAFEIRNVARLREFEPELRRG
jgi:hypothetical protein